MKINQVIVDESIKLGDNFDIELGNMVIESRVVGFMDDGIVIEADDKALALLGTSGALLEATDNDYWTNLIADVRAKAEAKERERWAAQAEIRDKERAEQLAKDRENLPTLEKYLAQLQSEYDPDYEYSDDHRVWTRNKEIKAKISNLQQRIKDAKGVSEVYAPAVGGKDFDQYTPAVDAAMKRHSAEKALYKAANPKDDPTGALQQKGFDRAQAVGQRLATKQALGKIKANETDDSFTKPAIIMRASPKAMAKAQSIIQKQADKNVISMAKIAGTTPAQGVAEEHHPSNPMYEIHSQGQQAGIAGKPRNNPYGDPDINREAYYWNEGYELGLEIRNKRQGVAEGSYDELDPLTKLAIRVIQQNKRRNEPLAYINAKQHLKDQGWSAREIKNLEQGQQGVAEGSQTVGHEILGMLRQINRQGDDAMEELYSSCPLLAQFWDQYEGDFRSMVIELSPKTLNRIKAEISAFNQQGVSEGNGTHIKRENPGQWRKAGYERGRFWAQHSGTRDTKGFADQQARDQWIRDQNNKVVAEGRMKEQMHTDAERMELAQFLDKYGNEDWIKEFWQNVNVDISEAKYQGREVPLGKPMAGDVKKSKVYVRGPKGNVVKVNFGDKNMRIKKSNPKRRKSFRARHNCANPGPRWKARYWSCRAW